MPEVYFSNIEKTLIYKVAAAKTRIFVAVAWFTNDKLLDELVKARCRDVSVQVCILDDIVNRNEFVLDFTYSIGQGIELYFASKDKMMHNKFCIIDDMVITGSYNWTYNANNNKENILCVQDREVTDKYIDCFNQIICDATKVTLPYNHLKWHEISEGDFMERARYIYRNIKYDSVQAECYDKLKKLHEAFSKRDIKTIKQLDEQIIVYKDKSLEEVLNNVSSYYNNFWHEYKYNKNYEGVNTSDEKIHKWKIISCYFENDKYGEFVKVVLCYLNKYKVTHIRGIKAKLKIYDKDFIRTLRCYDISDGVIQNKSIPEKLITINNAYFHYHKFEKPLFHKGHELMNNGWPNRIAGIKLFTILNSDRSGYKEGWDPIVRGTAIQEKFFKE